MHTQGPILTNLPIWGTSLPKLASCLKKVFNSLQIYSVIYSWTYTSKFAVYIYIYVINIWNVSIINMHRLDFTWKKIQILNNPSVSGYLQVALRKPCYSKMQLGLLEGPFVKQMLQKWDIFSHLKNITLSLQLLDNNEKKGYDRLLRHDSYQDDNQAGNKEYSIYLTLPPPTTLPKSNIILHQG